MLVALGTLASAQSRGTKATMKAAVQLLNYAATHPDAAICYYASGMQLHIHSDASYLSEALARSRVGGFFFLSGNDDPSPNAPAPPLNGAVHVVSSIMRNVMASAAEAELGGLFVNGQEACPIITTLEELGWKQNGPTPIQTNNAVADGIANDTIKQKRSKAMDMRFYWICDRVRQGQFRVHWKAGSTNRGDYFTKHHPTSHHIEERTVYVHPSGAQQ